LPDILCFLFLPFIHSWRILDDFLIPGAQAKIALSALCNYSLGRLETLRAMTLRQDRDGDENQ
jgi:hypothetical protein